MTVGEVKEAQEFITKVANVIVDQEKILKDLRGSLKKYNGFLLNEIKRLQEESYE